MSAEPVPPTPGPTPPNAPAPDAPPDDDRIVMTKEALSARLTRATRSAFKNEFGTEDPAEVKAKLEQLSKYEAEKEKERLESLSREQQLSEEVAREKAARTAAEKEAATARFEAQTSRLGIKNHDYAAFKIATAMNAHTGTEKFDERAYLDSLLTNRQERAALGIEDGPIPTVPVVPSTSPGNGNAPPPPPAGAPKTPKTAYDMSATEWQEFKAKNGL